MTQEALKMGLEELAVRFSEGWHEGIKIDASDIMLLNEAAQALAQPEQEPVAYDKTEMNCFVQDLYDKKMQEGKHGHYETMFHVVHQAIKRVPPQRTQVDLTDEEVFGLFGRFTAMTGKSWLDLYRMTEAKLKEKNT